MKFAAAIILSLLILATVTNVSADRRKFIKKKVKYKSHTQIDFGDQVVEGKIKTPEIFYIFQRKRSPGHNAITPPKGFEQHRKDTYVKLLEGIR